VTDLFTPFRETLAARQRRVMKRSRRAAVLVPIVDDQDGLRVVLTRRRADLRTHQGQVAFPGGMAEPGETPTQTALREANEEIDLQEGTVALQGVLDDFPTIYDNMCVTPVVGRLDHLPELTPEPSEVARIFTIPLAVLADSSAWRTEQMQRRGRTFPMYFCEHDGETLWGLSAYITMHLLDLFWPLGAPYELPD
jgi:8-oxo-dGTP pyrophosphatase MutT (NUDIX family)